MQISTGTIVGNSRASIYLDSKVSRRAAALDGIVADLNRVQGLASWLMHHVSPIQPDNYFTIEAVTWQLVMLYARCFDSAKGRSTRLSNQHVRMLKDASLTALHEELITARHATFAHPGDQCSDRAVVHLMYPRPPGVDPFSELYLCFHHVVPGAIIDVEKVTQLAALAKGLSSIALAAADKAKAMVHAEMRADWPQLFATLQANIGTYATQEQQTYADTHDTRPNWLR